MTQRTRKHDNILHIRYNHPLLVLVDLPLVVLVTAPAPHLHYSIEATPVKRFSILGDFTNVDFTLEHLDNGHSLNILSRSAMIYSPVRTPRPGLRSLVGEITSFIVSVPCFAHYSNFGEL